MLSARMRSERALSALWRAAGAHRKTQCAQPPRGMNLLSRKDLWRNS